MATMSHADSGAATAEFAVVLPAVAMVAMVLLCLTRTVTVSMRCQDAASAVVRELVTREGGLSGAGMSVNAVASGIAGEGAVAVSLTFRLLRAQMVAAVVRRRRPRTSPRRPMRR